MTETTGFRVTALWIYPTKDEPGISLPTVRVESNGFAGDRRKKAALHLVCAADAIAVPAPRANLVLDATADDLEALVAAPQPGVAHRTRPITLGTSVIEITGKPSNCPGIYAAVIRPGTINIGDRLDPSAG